MILGRKVYFHKTTGDVIIDTGERRGFVKETTIEQDILTYKALSERNRETFDVIKLEYGQYAQDFLGSNGYRVNPKTKELEFSYPDPNDEEQEKVFQEPLSEQVKRLESKQIETDSTLLDFMETVLLGGM